MRKINQREEQGLTQCSFNRLLGIITSLKLSQQDILLFIIYVPMFHDFPDRHKTKKDCY